MNSCKEIEELREILQFNLVELTILQSLVNDARTPTSQTSNWKIGEDIDNQLRLKLTRSKLSQAKRKLKERGVICFTSGGMQYHLSEERWKKYKLIFDTAKELKRMK